LVSGARPSKTLLLSTWGARYSQVLPMGDHMTSTALALGVPVWVYLAALHAQL
jgi:hypothetical protein